MAETDVKPAQAPGAEAPNDTDSPKPEVAAEKGAAPNETAKPAVDVDTSKPEDFEGHVATDNEIPSLEVQKKIEDYIVLDKDGKSRTFKSLYSGNNSSRRVLVIFVRHFFCGMCQDFLRSLSQRITTESLLNLPISTFITVVGCGDPSLIDMYVRETSCPFPVFTDPKRSLFTALGMTKTLAAGSQPQYAQRSFWKNAIESTFLTMKHIPKGQGFISGDKRQVGGEFLFEPLDLHSPITTPQEAVGARNLLSRDGEALTGLNNSGHGAEGDDHEEKRITWCHRMKTTRDHSEIEELQEVLGLPSEEKNGAATFQRKGTGISMASKMSEMQATRAAA